MLLIYRVLRYPTITAFLMDLHIDCHPRIADTYRPCGPFTKVLIIQPPSPSVPVIPTTLPTAPRESCSRDMHSALPEACPKLSGRSFMGAHGLARRELPAFWSGAQCIRCPRYRRRPLVRDKGAYTVSSRASESRMRQVKDATDQLL